MYKKTLRLVITGLMLAIATVLSMVTILKMPYGGGVTMFSMLPVMLLGYKYGVKWGLCSGLVFGVLQALVGTFSSGAFAGVTGFSVVAMVVLDYLVAMGVIGLAGMFRGKIKNHTVAFATGAVVAGLFRLLAHFVSGVLLFSGYAEGFFTGMGDSSFAKMVLDTFSGTGLAMFYSIFYNGSYLIPEILITVIGIVAIMAVKPLKKQILTVE